LGKIRVAVVGVGNCASSLIQGVHFYRNAPENEFVPGLMHVNLGGYHIGDIEFSAAFDIDANKVGKDLAEAIWARPNDTYRFADVPKTGITVSRGMTHDGIGKYLAQVVEKAPGAAESSADTVLLSMNLWRFSPAIFEACREVPLSSRGERELPQAVGWAIAVRGERYRGIPCREGVLDLSTRADVAEVERRLQDVEARP